MLLALRTRVVSWAIRASVPVLNLVRRPVPWPSSFAGRVLFVWGALMLPEYVAPMRAALARGHRSAPVREELFPSELRDPIRAEFTDQKFAQPRGITDARDR